MNKYYCDICGKELPNNYKSPEVMSAVSIEHICGIVDVCPYCMTAGESVDIKATVLKAWQKKVFPQPAEED